jgi:TrmH family RNA methyltransferase
VSGSARAPSPPVRFVLVRPRVGENVGATARVLRNFGLSDWALVAPEGHDPAAARRLAVGATELLEAVPVHATLEEAVADCVWVVGTESRAVPGRRGLHPAEMAREAAAGAGRGRTALVFGGERDGLRAAEIRRCDAISRIPTDPGQPSLNLAQAVAVYAWALREHARPAPDGAPGGPRGASDEELLDVETALREALRRGGFLSGPERHAVRDLSATLRRGRLTRREARLWIAALRRLGRS